MLGKFKRLFFIAFITVLGVASTICFAEPQDPLLEQFNQVTDWQQKKEIADQLLLTKQLTSQQRLAIYSTMAERAFTENDYPLALDFYQSQEKNSNINDSPEQYFRSIKMQGVVYYYQGLMQQAIKEYSRALAIAKQLNNALKQANLLSNIGLAYFDMYNMDLALDHYQKAKAIYETHGSVQDKADILHNIAGIYIKLSRYDSALEFYREVLAVFQQLDDKDGIAQVYGNMGVAYVESGRNQLALHYYQLALRYYQSINDAYQLSIRHKNLANLNLKLNEIDTANYHALAAKEFAIKADNKSLLLTALHVLAKVQLVKGNINEARVNLNESFALAKKYNNVMLAKEGLGINSLLLASVGDYKQAVDLHAKFVEYQQSIRSEEVVKALTVFQTQFKANQLNQEILQLKQERDLQDLKIAKRSQLSILLAIVMVLGLICSIALYRRSIERKAKIQLSEQVEQRTQELQFVAQELRAANEVKSQFLANISHEIRTPLTAILGQTDDLINGLYEPQDLKAELLVIKKHSDHLKDLINDVLDISKIEANRLELHLTKFDLIELVNDVYEMCQAHASQKGLSLAFENQLAQSHWVKLDLMRVKQILINLLTNAIKFTQRGSVTLRLSKTQSGVQFNVIDTGIGMSVEQLKMVFECFQQGDNTISRRFGGSGLGLSLSQQLAMMMGGYISALSEPDKGSEFIFNLPCKQKSAGPLSSSVIRNSQQVQLQGKVVLAEDHPDNRRLITRYLTSLGLEVIAVSDGEKAVEQCLQQYPDIVLLDIQMPIMDGLSALALLQQCGFSNPIYALTANAMSHEIENYMSLGFTGYLSKPIDKKVFYNTLASQLEQNNKQPVSESKVDMTDLTQSFIKSFREEAESLSMHLQQCDYKALQQDSHRILGAAQMFEVHDVIKPALNLDQALLNNRDKYEVDDVASLTHVLIDALDAYSLK
ncbi:tetratricopeptide repeat protein [Pseudoalteromonas sp. H105]|uniref:tetratricopeptide repeat-containing hybrid sensor histidine kinase/response regulator n=1 Tax=Pseudoalteromonas sp. H105 TaxID=1348393 RepID=UPI0007321957|nr:tetratricopeptide repeat protein [Pseudoalteromonas sp. H105]KTF13818.1 hybrid sensor histidine kinase/response regulator [Pseudoalteromonas sp. H105]